MGQSPPAPPSLEAEPDFPSCCRHNSELSLSWSVHSQVLFHLHTFPSISTACSFNSGLLNGPDMWFLCESVQHCLSPFLWPFLILSPSPRILTRDLMNWDSTPLPLTVPLILTPLLTSPYPLTLNPFLSLLYQNLTQMYTKVFSSSSAIVPESLCSDFLSSSLGCYFPLSKRGNGPVGHLNNVTTDVRTQGLMLASFPLSTMLSFYKTLLMKKEHHMDHFIWSSQYCRVGWSYHPMLFEKMKFKETKWLNHNDAKGTNI